MIDKKPLSEMSDEEILNELRSLRDRRASAAQAKATARAAPSAPKKKGDEITGSLGSLLDQLLGDSNEQPT